MSPVVVAVGLCTVDLVQRVDALPAPGEKVQSRSVELAAGGPATNAAVAIAALGGTSRLVTVLGAHPLARLAAEDLATHEVEVVDTQPNRTAPPPISAVTVRFSDGERTVVSHNAAGMTTKPTTALHNAKALLLDGHHPELALAAARTAKEQGIPVVLDAGSWKPVMTELLHYVDICACSATFRSEIPVPTPVITRTHGPDPVTWQTKDASGEVKPPPATPRDTTGAGDVWHGALTLAVAKLGRIPTAQELPALLHAANQAAKIRIEHEGARTWVTPMRTRKR